MPSSQPSKIDSPLPPQTEGAIRYLVFDTETSGLPAEEAGRWASEWKDSSPYLWPDILQLTAEVWEIKDGIHSQVGETFNWWINTDIEIDPDTSELNGITNAFLNGKAGHKFTEEVLDKPAPYFPEVKEEILALLNDKSIDFVVAHNMPFDEWVLRKNIEKHGGSGDELEFERDGYEIIFDTTQETKELCQIHWKDTGKIKRVHLGQLYGILFPGDKIKGAHDARGDVKATVRIVKELHRRRIFAPDWLRGFLEQKPEQNLDVNWEAVNEEHKSGVHERTGREWAVKLAA